jgi:hypothetical protein
MKFIQCDDFLTDGEADFLETMFSASNFPWGFFANVNYNRPPPEGIPGRYGKDPRFEDSFGFGSVIYPGAGPTEETLKYPMLAFQRFLQRHRIEAQQLIRLKANLLVQSAVAGGPKPFVPHVDLPTPHWVVIYYLNDSDGDTVLLDKTYPDWENAQVLHSVSPKKGRAILFDGRHYHAGTPPHQHTTRLVLNYNFV